MDTQMQTLRRSERHDDEAAAVRRQRFVLAEKPQPVAMPAALSIPEKNTDHQLRVAEQSRALDSQLLMSQLWLAAALYFPQSMPPARQDTASRQPQRIEMALARYQAVASSGEAEPGASLAATA
jgi:hypothetical protein